MFTRPYTIIAIFWSEHETRILTQEKNEKELFKKEHMIYFSFSNSISNISQVEGLNIYD